MRIVLIFYNLLFLILGIVVNICVRNIIIKIIIDMYNLIFDNWIFIDIFLYCFGVNFFM